MAHTYYGRTVAHLVLDGLQALVVAHVPHLHRLGEIARDELVVLLVDRHVLHRGGVAHQLRHRLAAAGVRVPDGNGALEPAAGEHLMSKRSQSEYSAMASGAHSPDGHSKHGSRPQSWRAHFEEVGPLEGVDALAHAMLVHLVIGQPQ